MDPSITCMIHIVLLAIGRGTLRGTAGSGVERLPAPVEEPRGCSGNALRRIEHRPYFNTRGDLPAPIMLHAEVVAGAPLRQTRIFMIDLGAAQIGRISPRFRPN